MNAAALVAVLVGALAGTGVFLLVVAARGQAPRPRPAGGRPGPAQRALRDLAGPRGAAAAVGGLAALVATGWVVAAVGVALLVLGWRGLTGAGDERRQLARLEALATWTESLRDSIAGAIGLEQAIPASARAAAPVLRPSLDGLVDRLLARAPMADALRSFADDLGDPSADLIIAALIINAQLRGPGLRDLLGSLARSVREEVDVRRRVQADRRSTRRGAQIVVGVSAGLALALALFDHGYVRVYDSASGQLVLVVVAALYAAGMIWMRRLARFEPPGRLLAGGGAGFESAAARAGWEPSAARAGRQGELPGAPLSPGGLRRPGRGGAW